MWQSQLRWETLKTAADRPEQQRPIEGSAPGITEQQDSSLRAQRRGTVVEFLDEFERMSGKYPAHRELVVAAKKAANQLKENMWLGILVADYDWSENGLISSARQIQSEYWCLKYFSLFITIISYLLPDPWHEDASLLKTGDEVTVEPEGSPAGASKPANGSFYAVVHIAPATAGTDLLYSVRKNDGTVIGGIKRRHMRHRVFNTEAFASITDEKRHDGNPNPANPNPNPNPDPNTVTSMTPNPNPYPYPNPRLHNIPLPQPHPSRALPGAHRKWLILGIHRSFR